MTVLVKDPDAILDWTIDWNDGYLQTNSPPETIATSQWFVEPDDSPALTVADSSKTDTTATVKLSGGAHGFTYRVTNRITTSRDRTDDRSLIIRVEPT